MMSREPAGWKVELVNSLVDSIQKSPVVGIVSVSGVPGPQLQNIRAKLRDHLTIKVIKNNLLEIALKKAGEKVKGVERLTDNIDGQMALMLSDLNPFKINKLMDETKTKMPAKGGEISPEDIEIKAGETSFKPGPIIGELQKAGVPAAIEHGKVMIKKDKVLVKKGEVISRDLALVLTKLEIYPLTVGLELRAAFEDGIVFERSTLDIDRQEYLDNVQIAARNALNLSLYAAIPNKVSIGLLLAKAHSEAFNLAMSSEYTTEETIKLLISKANAQSLALASRLPDEALDDDAKGKLSQRPKAEPAFEAETKKNDDEERKDKDQEEKKVSEDEAASGLGALFG